MSQTILIRDEDHYDKVIEKIREVRSTLWIGTADIKDLYVKNARGTKPLLGILAERARAGVEIRLLHAKGNADLIGISSSNSTPVSGIIKVPRSK